MEASFALFRTTGDRRHLDAAHALLEHLIRHAPEQYRRSMVVGVPQNRDIAAAFRG